MVNQLKKYIKINENSESIDIRNVCENLRICSDSAPEISDFVFYPGMNIYACGAVGAKGVQIITELKRAELQKNIGIKCIWEALSFENEFSDIAAPDSFSLNISERGILQSLFRLSKLSKLGFEINIEDIPILQSTIEISDFYKINPYNLLSYGCRLIVSSDAMLDEISIGARLLGNMHYLKKIGTLKSSPEMVIKFAGVRTLLNRPGPDELLKII